MSKYIRFTLTGMGPDGSVDLDTYIRFLHAAQRALTETARCLGMADQVQFVVVTPTDAPPYIAQTSPEPAPAETPAAQIAAAQARAATAAAAYRATGWQLVGVCAVLEQDVPALTTFATRLLELATRVLTPRQIGTLLVPPGIIYDEQGRRCYWCGWHSPDEDAVPVHAPGCLVLDALAVLAGGTGAEVE